jgi:hypothetical protein
MEGLELSTIFIPPAPAVTRDFCRGQRLEENNLTVRDGSYREIYIRKVIIARRFFEGSVSYGHKGNHYQSKGISKNGLLNNFIRL